MGRRMLPKNEAVEHQIEAWCIADVLEDELPPPLLPKVWAIKDELLKANGLLEFGDDRRAA